MRKKKSSHFIEITKDEDQQSYNIADTTRTAEDELITEQNHFPVTAIHQGAQTILSGSDSVALLSGNELSGNCQ